MKKFLLVFFSLCFLSQAFAQTNFSPKKDSKPNPILIEKPNAFFTVGEKLRFEVSWMGVNVGYGEIEIKEMEIIRGRPTYHVTAEARTNDFLSKLYPVHDQIHSWIDAENFHSLKFRKILSEGRYRADEEIEFYPQEKRGTYHSYKNGTRKEFEIPGAIHDIVSAFYWFRLQPVSVGGSAKTLVNSEEKNWDAEIRVLGTQTKAIRGFGLVDTFYVEPKSSLKGVFFDRGRVWVYFTADPHRVPVWVQFKTPFGPINGVLATPVSSPKSFIGDHTLV